MITLLGLGTEKGDLTLKQLEKIKSGNLVVLRTSVTESAKTLDELNITYKTLDFIYEKSRNFDTLNRNLAKEILSYSKIQDVVYCVDGAVQEDNSCKEIIKKTKYVEIFEGVSKTSKCLSLFGEFGEHYSTSAYEINSLSKPIYPILVYDIDSVIIASETKLVLAEKYGDECPVKMFINGKVVSTTLCEIDFYDNYDYTTCLFIEKVDFLHKKRYDIDDLTEILKYLRSPNGCPWDREQTSKSIRKNLIEECYELADAIDREDDVDLEEEIGDVYMQLVFQTLFGEERKSFTYYDVMTGICKKLISRHTHVFGKDNAVDSKDVLALWENNKVKEKKYNSGGEYVSAVPKNFPAMMRAEKVMNRAKKYNFEFDNVEQIFDKIREEIEEVRAEIKSGNAELLQKECGDLLCASVNAVRFLGFECEETLTLSIEKFIDRFTKLEQAILKDGKDIKTLSSDERERYYEMVKKS